MEALWTTVCEQLLRFRLWHVMREDYRASKFTWGKHVRDYDGGCVAWTCPWRDTIEIIRASEQGIELPVVTVETTDGVQRTYEGSIYFEIINAYKAITKTDDYEDNLPDLAASCIAHAAEGMNDGEARMITAVSDAALLDIRKVATEKWGQKITRVSLRTSARSRFYRLKTD